MARRLHLAVPARNAWLAGVSMVTLGTLLACFEPPALAPQCPTRGNPTIRLDAGDSALMVEVAATEPVRQCGLAQRESLPADRGMLFVYPDDRRVSFWMRDTQFALSLAFLDAAGCITQRHDMSPDQPTRRYPASEPIRFALEVSPGWFERQSLGPGDCLNIRLPAGTLIE